MAQHGRAGAGGRYDDFGLGEGFEEVAGDGSRFVAVAAVEGRLPAAGLRWREDDGDADMLQDVDHGHARLRINHVHDAGNEEGNGFANWRFALGQCHRRFFR